MKNKIHKKLKRGQIKLSAAEIPSIEISKIFLATGEQITVKVSDYTLEDAIDVTNHLLALATKIKRTKNNHYDVSIG